MSGSYGLGRARNEPRATPNSRDLGRFSPFPLACGRYGGQQARPASKNRGSTFFQIRLPIRLSDLRWIWQRSAWSIGVMPNCLLYELERVTGGPARACPSGLREEGVEKEQDHLVEARVVPQPPAEPKGGRCWSATRAGADFSRAMGLAGDARAWQLGCTGFGGAVPDELDLRQQLGGAAAAGREGAAQAKLQGDFPTRPLRVWSSELIL